MATAIRSEDVISSRSRLCVRAWMGRRVVGGGWVDVRACRGGVSVGMHVWVCPRGVPRNNYQPYNPVTPQA